MSMSTDNPLWLTFDLEMNQPSNKIIQIGACIGNIHTGEILKEYSFFINPGEQITPYITQLTGVTQEMVESSPHSVESAWMAIEPDLRSLNVNYSPITWGGGDLRTLRQQLPERTAEQLPYRIGRREMDVKTLVQFRAIYQNKHLQGGLAKQMVRDGLHFKGTKHDALDDAKNTFWYAVYLARVFR